MIYVLTKDLASYPLVIVAAETVKDTIELLGMWHTAGKLSDDEEFAVRQAFINAKPPSDGLLGTACAAFKACDLCLTLQYDVNSFEHDFTQKEKVACEDWCKNYQAIKSEQPVTIRLYPLNEQEIVAALLNAGYVQHEDERMHELACTEVYVWPDGTPQALYEFWYLDDEGTHNWVKLWVKVKDGKLHAEY